MVYIPGSIGSNCGQNDNDFANMMSHLQNGPRKSVRLYQLLIGCERLSGAVARLTPDQVKPGSTDDNFPLSRYVYVHCI